jgi:hypothetical protein
MSMPELARKTIAVPESREPDMLARLFERSRLLSPGKKGWA